MIEPMGMLPGDLAGGEQGGTFPAPSVDTQDAFWDWSGRGTSHVDFGKDEALPLQGEFLGYGIHGGVYGTICSGKALARGRSAWALLGCLRLALTLRELEAEVELRPSTATGIAQEIRDVE
ncbi:hypothetical protein FGG08_005500 [Glutinoglossum americanum]|uniref:Uncharacterized protein n=1 Tax=Glutinoglossum americanum TaxID=1670608 RepID=A0A9P8L1C9_9PEZI|nr:hypothetical protein FGG08_005500 [Glutinoglossum americanum]